LPTLVALQALYLLLATLGCRAITQLNEYPFQAAALAVQTPYVHGGKQPAKANK
jgi:hypothetical protein